MYKKNEINDSQPAPPTMTVKPNGILYINCVGEFAKINTIDGTVFWTTPTRNLFASWNNPKTFDSTTFYHGHYSGLTAYNSQTGVPRWSFSWLTFSDAMTYREPAFKDSLLFLTSATNVWDHGYLYCLNKQTGRMYWKKELDKGYVDRLYNTSPMVIDDKVIVLTRDAKNHNHLSAFRTVDGAQLWTTGINDSLAFRLQLVDGKIYSTSNQNVICYNAGDGSLKWQTDLKFSSFDATSTFFEQDRLIVVKVLANKFTIFTVNTADGMVIKKTALTIPVQDSASSTLGCSYSKNTLFVAYHHNFDSVGLKAYNLSDLRAKWEKRFASYYYSYLTPLLTDRHLVFPINNSYPNGNSIMFFLDLNGSEVARIPFNANSTDGFVYFEKDITYRQYNAYVSR